MTADSCVCDIEMQVEECGCSGDLDRGNYLLYYMRTSGQLELSEKASIKRQNTDANG